MTLTTLIEPGIGEWRSAQIDTDEFPVAIAFHGDASLSPVDAIFRARVTRVDTTLDMAFLDLGDGLDGALNLRRAKLLVKGRADTIGDCVREGDMLNVQVVAEPAALEGKALPVTPKPRLLGRYLVVEAGAGRLNFSKDLSPKAQKALMPLLSDLAANAAIIVRSTAGDVAPEAVAAEANLLVAGIVKSADRPGLAFSHGPLVQALLSVPSGDGEILVEGGSALTEAKALANRHWPDLAPRLQAYKGRESLFEAFGVNEALEEALAPRIDLPSGGWISITPTPALTAIDVNMGSALKGRSANEAKLITNMEAAMAVAYHLRFQDIGGLVVVDFIDLSAKGAARELMATVDAAFREDSVPVQHTGLSQFGLMEVRRKRSGLSLRDRLLLNRPPADRPAAHAIALLRTARREGLRPEPGDLLIEAPKAVLDWITSHSSITQQLATETGRSLEMTQAATASASLRMK